MDDTLNRLRAELTGRYEVEQELGHGGMAVVYLAKDLRHERRVAIKVLRSDLGSSGGDRFLREIRTVAQLHHPHILQLLESGTAGDHLFYVMPYVDGETIRQRLEREGQLPIDDAVRIAREVADALDFAHGRGIVHRDIKPENIFLSAGHAVVADFGIARAADAAAGAGPTTTLTDAGVAVGTPAYMSPEQATADPRIDGRSDQYALGCVLYEMLAGQPPFTGPTSQAIMARHTTDPVPPLRTVRDVPVALESAINKALAKMPADRWPDVAVFSDELNRASRSNAAADSEWTTAQSRRRQLIIGITAASLLVAFGVLRALSSSERVDDDDAVLGSLALRPFSFSGDTLAALYAQGMADGLLPGLTRVGSIRVLAPGRVAGIARPEDDDVAIARKLGVSAVLSGEVRILDGKLRVVPRLTRVRDSAIVWTENYYADLGAVFDMQDSMAVRIVGALIPRLTSGDRSLAARGTRTRNQEAYELWLRGNAAGATVSTAGADEALRYYEAAIALDSGFADAWSGLAGALDNMLQFSGRSPIELLTRLRTAVERAALLDSLNPGVLALRARAKLFYEFDYDGYERIMQRAIQLYPNDAGLSMLYGQDLQILGRFDSAFAMIRRAERLDSTHAFIVEQVAFLAAIRGQFNEAREAVRRSLALDPNGWAPHLDLAMMAAYEGRHDEAAREANEARRILLDSQWVLPYVIQCARHAEPETSRQLMSRLVALSRTQYVQHVQLAHAYLSMGDRERAIDELEASLRIRDRDFLPKVGIGEFEPLKGHPRYEAVLKAAGLDRFLRLGLSERGLNIVTC